MQIRFRILSILAVAQFVRTEISEIDPEPEVKIIGGFPERPGTYQAVVALAIWRNKQRSWCSGTVLDNNTVLTAGHCLVNATAIKIYVNCAEVNTCQQARFGVGHIHPNIGVVQNLTINDLGVVKTSVSLGASRFVRLGQPARFYKNCTAMGYGRNENDRIPRHRKLYWLQVKDIMSCSAVFPYDTRFGSTLCSIAQVGKRLSKGDSGGPLFCGTKQVGVNSQLLTNYNSSTRRNQTIMLWIVPYEYTGWVTVQSSANRRSNLVLLIFFLLHSVRCIGTAQIYNCEIKVIA